MPARSRTNADDVVERRVVAQLQRVVARDPVGLADRGEHLGLLDRVDPEVGLEVEVQVEQVGRVAGLLGDDGEDALGDSSCAGAAEAAAAAGSGARRARRRAPRRCGGSARGRRTAGSSAAGATPARSRTKRDDVVERRVVAQLQRVVARDPVGLADRGEHLGLLDRVDPEVGLEVEVQVEQVGRVAGLLGDDREDALGDLVLRGRGRGSRGAARRAGGGGRGGGRLGSGPARRLGGRRDAGSLADERRRRG